MAFEGSRESTPNIWQIRNASRASTKAINDLGFLTDEVYRSCYELLQSCIPDCPVDMEPVSLKNQLYEEESSSLPKNKLYKNHSYLEEHFSDALTPAEADVIHSRFTSGLDMVDEIQEAQDTIIEEWRSVYLLPYKHVPFRFHLQGFLPRGEELNPHTIALVWKWTGRKGLNDCDEWRELLAEAEKFIREVKERGSKEMSRWEPVTSTTLQHRRGYAFMEY